jgi:predicted AlkP superfamily pyrophosphatase or phosphodiesterase
VPSGAGANRAMRSFRRSAAGLLAGLVVASGCAAPPPPEGTPRLVVLIVVDQMRYDYLVRFGPLFSGGLRRLLDESVSFTDARHDHAITTTAPGHATLATGLYPSHHGIVDNYWTERGDGDRTYAVGDSRYGRSPRHLLAPTLGDWFKRASGRSKVFAASGKDRAAILLGGRRADGVFWFDEEKGGFTTSRYYPARPRWLADFNGRHPADELFGAAWEPLPETAEVLADPQRRAAFGIEDLDRGLFPRPFPHPLGGLAFAPGEDFYGALFDSPLQDALLARLAVTLIDAEGLGADAYPDLLALSFSAVDEVGHAYGPDSPEILDTLLRLDRSLGEVLDAVDRRIGRRQVVVALSADHGVLPLPEVRRFHGLPGRRIDAGTVRCFQQAGERLSRRLGEGRWLTADGSIDEKTLAASGRGRAEVEQAARREIESCPGVERVWTRTELASGAAAADPVGRLYAHSFHPQRSGDLLVQFEEYFLPRLGDGTTHGSPYDYDTHVPWLLRLPTGGPAAISQRVSTVDVAPTLATLAGVAPPPGLDGVDRRPLLSAR